MHASLVLKNQAAKMLLIQWSLRSSIASVCVKVSVHLYGGIPYRGKFLRGPIFAVFVVGQFAAKIKPTK